MSHRVLTRLTKDNLLGMLAPLRRVVQPRGNTDQKFSFMFYLSEISPRSAKGVDKLAAEMVLICIIIFNSPIIRGPNGIANSSNQLHILFVLTSHLL